MSNHEPGWVVVSDIMTDEDGLQVVVDGPMPRDAAEYHATQQIRREEVERAVMTPLRRDSELDDVHRAEAVAAVIPVLLECFADLHLDDDTVVPIAQDLVAAVENHLL